MLLKFLKNNDINIILIYLIIGLILNFNKKSNILACGMCGYSGKDDFNADKIKQLLLSNISRGMHSTGIYNNGVIEKDSVNAIEFLAKNEIIPSTLFMGHDRHATVGGKSDSKNAHPFQYGTIIGQHNGTLTNHWELARGHNKTMADYDVDSQVLIHELSLDKDRFTGLQKFEGAAALIWHNTDYPNRLYCFRNSARPLYRGSINENMYISSIEESLMLIGCSTIREFKEGYVYPIENGKILPVKHIVRKTKKQKGNNFKHNATKDNTRSDKSIVTSQLSSWVKFTGGYNGYTNDALEIGTWYNVEEEASNNLYKIRLAEKAYIYEYSKYFSEFEKLDINGHVYVTELDKSGYFEVGEILFLRGLEMNKVKDRVDAVLEKLTDDDHVYTWASKFIRNASIQEVEDFIHSSTENIISKTAISDEQLFDDFENNKMFFDDDDNRLGNIYAEIGAGYENLIKIRTELDKVSKIIDTAFVLHDMPKLSTNDLIDIDEKVTEAFGISDSEINRIFDKVFEENSDLYEG
jgi:hypothetical protein